MPVNESSITFSFIHSSGPGGQNVNKVATAVELRLDLERSNLSEFIISAIRKRFPNRINKQGELIITARKYRTQLENRNYAISRLNELIEAASQRRKVRIKTKPTTASRTARITTKKQRGEIKSKRGTVRDWD
jgi:ribosome-associated protein